VKRLFAYLWAAPVSAAALPALPLALATGGSSRIRDGVLEIEGGALSALLSRGLPGFPISAITLGHVVLAADAGAHARCRAHERVHVRQYERWGVAFPILYLASSIAAVFSGGSAYRDNAFEKAAFREEDACLA
jgi:hypothetical protein